MKPNPGNQVHNFLKTCVLDRYTGYCYTHKMYAINSTWALCPVVATRAKMRQIGELPPL